MRYALHVPCDKYFLIVLMDHWCDDTNIFHLPIGDITITLTNIHRILQLPMNRKHIKRVILSMEQMEDQCYYLICIQHYQQLNKGSPLHEKLYMPPQDVENEIWFRLYIIVLIYTILYSDKNHECFHMGLILVFHGIFLQGERYAWDPCILAQLYQDLQNFMTVENGGRIVAHLVL